jgi:hypothetical protein
MIQDKIFFDEKDPTGVSYNTPFTVYGSYEGRLWSKTPSGTIKYYTQNSDLSVYATTGSNQFNGNQTVTGSLTVTGGITGTVTTASYVEYAGVANKPTLVSSSAQIVGYGIFATTGSNQFNGNQAVTGSLTVTGQVVAQTLNVQQVTSSIVFSSGSNIFGNTQSNTQQFTGSVSVTGSLTVTTTGTELQVTNTGVTLGNTLTDAHNVTGSLKVSGSFTVTTTGTELQVTNTGVNLGNITTDVHNITGSLRVSGSNQFNGNVGIGTTSPGNFSGLIFTGPFLDVAGLMQIKGTSANTIAGLQFGGDTFRKALIYSSVGTADPYFAIGVGTTGNDSSATERMHINSSGNVGIGVTPSAWDNTIFRGLQIGTVRPAFLIGRTDAVSQVQLGTNAYYDGNWKYFATGEASRYYQGVGQHVWESAISGNANASITWLPQMLITSGGNVGIGATPSAWNTTSRALQLTSFVSLSQQHSGALNLMSYAIESSANSFTYGATGVYPTRLNMNPNDGVITFFNAGTGTAGNTITFNPRLTITADGNVGIGTTDTQTFRLAVDGPNVTQGDVTTTIRIFDTTSAAAGTGGGISFAGYSSGTSSIVNTLSYIKGGKENSTGGDFASYLSFGTRINGGSPTERMRITSGGFVGINTTSPGSYRLYVNGASYLDGYNYASSIQFIRAASDTVAPASGNGILIFAGGNAQMRMSTANVINFDMNNGGSPYTALLIRQNGNTVSINSPDNQLSLEIAYQGVGHGYLGATASYGRALLAYSQNGGYVYLSSSSTWINASDRNRKKNFENYNKGLAEICNLKPTLFNLKTQSDDMPKIAGLIAQEVGEHLPEAFSDGEFIGIDYSVLTVTMINAIKELKSENDTLKSILQRNNIS